MKLHLGELMERAVAEGVRYGWNRAWKHVPEGGQPNDDAAVAEIVQAVMTELTGIADWDEAELC